MRKFWNLVKRHCLVFLRDKTAVFFSFLAMIIIIVLMGVFLSKMNVDSILSLLEQFRHSKATATDRKNATELVNYCILAGILMTNSLTSLLKVIVGIALNVVLFSIGAYGISLGLRSSKGWSTLASISGTLVGFLGGVYLPMGYLPKGVASVLKFLPFLHGASILRKSCVQAALDKTFAGCPSEIATNYQEYVGITVKAGGHVLSTAAQVGIMTLWLVAALAAVFAISRRKHLNR